VLQETLEMSRFKLREGSAVYAKEIETNETLKYFEDVL
jgi:hypothetical protein